VSVQSTVLDAHEMRQKNDTFPKMFRQNNLIQIKTFKLCLKLTKIKLFIHFNKRFSNIFRVIHLFQFHSHFISLNILRSKSIRRVISIFLIKLVEKLADCRIVALRY